MNGWWDEWWVKTCAVILGAGLLALATWFVVLSAVLMGLSWEEPRRLDACHDIDGKMTRVAGVEICIVEVTRNGRDA